MRYIVIFLLASCATMSHKKTTHWNYQLQKYDQRFFKRMGMSSEALWVIDYSKDGSEDKKFTAQEIDMFKSRNNVILSYLSIGEAEDYRYYFKSMPKDLIKTENPEWKGNYPVKYWEEQWKTIIFKNEKSYLNRIQAAGFDGVYLDIVDAFQYYKDKTTYAVKMANFIQELSVKAKKNNPQFKIYIQNGVDIIDYLDNKQKTQFYAAIDGISLEAILFNSTTYQMMDTAPIEKLVKQYQKQHKHILSVEYTVSLPLMNRYKRFIQKMGIEGLITDSQLKGRSFLHFVAE
jgi:cysteinyl-tRNA synthetase